jgi:hypothetical protein
MHTRAERRAHRERMVARAIRSRLWAGNPEGARKNADHIVACSCAMCANRRAIDGPTIGERRKGVGDRASLLDLDDVLDDIARRNPGFEDALQRIIDR